MNHMPRKLKTRVSAQEILQVEHWWEKLSPQNQRELQALYLEDLPHKRQFVSIYLCGQFVEQEQVPNPYDDSFWINHFYEYLINHEIIIDDRHFHVGGTCSATKAAEKALRSGLIRKAFACPNKDKTCLMKQILSYEEGKKDFRFYLKFELEQDSLDTV